MLQRRAFLRRAAAMAAVLGLDPMRLIGAETAIPEPLSGLADVARFRQ